MRLWLICTLQKEMKILVQRLRAVARAASSFWACRSTCALRTRYAHEPKRDSIKILISIISMARSVRQSSMGQYEYAMPMMMTTSLAVRRF